MNDQLDLSVSFIPFSFCPLLIFHLVIVKLILNFSHLTEESLQAWRFPSSLLHSQHNFKIFLKVFWTFSVYHISSFIIFFIIFYYVSVAFSSKRAHKFYLNLIFFSLDDEVTPFHRRKKNLEIRINCSEFVSVVTLIDLLKTVYTSDDEILPDKVNPLRFPKLN